jgi:hypothetical protein
MIVSASVQSKTEHLTNPDSPHTSHIVSAPKVPDARNDDGLPFIPLHDIEVDAYVQAEQLRLICSNNAHSPRYSWS